MGLDCTAYEKVTLIRECSRSSLSDDDYDAMYEAEPRQLFLEQPDDVFDGRSDGLVVGVYQTDGESFGWHAGSYGGYGAWRRALCRAALDVEPEDVWNNREKYDGSWPFVSLIDFSDCEGFLGPQTCARLLADFESHPWLDKKMSSGTGESDYWSGLTDEWRKAFRIAAGQGVIEFH